MNRISLASLTHMARTYLEHRYKDVVFPLVTSISGKTCSKWTYSNMRRHKRMYSRLCAVTANALQQEKNCLERLVIKCASSSSARRVRNSISLTITRIYQPTHSTQTGTSRVFTSIILESDRVTYKVRLKNGPPGDVSYNTCRYVGQRT